MNASTKIQFASTQIAQWMSKYPTATRVAMFVLPLTIALAVALATGTSVYACPSGSCGTGGG